MSIATSIDRPILYAHRGAAAERPENTLPSFRRAMELGADALETDVHMTRDGHLVVSHDSAGLRMCGAEGAIREHTLAEVQGWDAGWGFRDAAGEHPFRGAGYRMPTLEEVLVEFDGIPINIDLKQKTPPIALQAIDLIRRVGAEARVTLASFSLGTLLEVRRHGYRGPTGLAQAEVAALVFAPRLAFRALPLTGNAAQLPLQVGPLRLDTVALVDKCHSLGIRVNYWTINEPDEAERLLDLGADGIMTDDPAAIAPVFRARYG